jgi:hypothetical protein
MSGSSGENVMPMKATFNVAGGGGAAAIKGKYEFYDYASYPFKLVMR